MSEQISPIDPNEMYFAAERKKTRRHRDRITSHGGGTDVKTPAENESFYLSENEFGKTVAAEASKAIQAVYGDVLKTNLTTVAPGRIEVKPDPLYKKDYFNGIVSKQNDEVHNLFLETSEQFGTIGDEESMEAFKPIVEGSTAQTIYHPKPGISVKESFLKRFEIERDPQLIQLGKLEFAQLLVHEHIHLIGSLRDVDNLDLKQKMIDFVIERISEGIALTADSLLVDKTREFIATGLRKILDSQQRITVKTQGTMIFIYDRKGNLLGNTGYDTNEEMVHMFVEPVDKKLQEQLLSGETKEAIENHEKIHGFSPATGKSNLHGVVDRRHMGQIMGKLGLDEKGLLVAYQKGELMQKIFEAGIEDIIL